MYVRGEIHGTKLELGETISDIQNLVIELESYTDVGCLHSAIDYLYDLLEADVEE